MYAPPPRQTSEVFTRMPDGFRKKERSGEWFSHQPAMTEHHSVLEGPSFDQDGNLYCVDIPWVIFGSTQALDLVVEYEGEPNGLRASRQADFVADHRRGIVVVDPRSGPSSPI
jgi:gluconolactonase